MFGSTTLGRLMGVELKVHWTFWLLVGLILVPPIFSGAGLDFALGQAAFLAAVFSIVLFHEFGHVLTARQFGIGTTDVTLLPIGGIARLVRIPREPHQELAVALGGPLVNLVIAIVLWPWVSFSPFSSADGFVVGLVELDFVSRLFWVNLSMMLFNLLPAFPLDGGRVLRALLALKFSYVTATAIASHIGVFIAAFLAVMGFMSFNVLLVAVAVFIALGAMQEAHAVRVGVDRKEEEVVEATFVMLPQVENVSPRESLRRAAVKLNEASSIQLTALNERK